MKFVSKLLLSGLLVSCLSVVTVKAEPENEIQKADKIIGEFCVAVQAFFNKANNESFANHINRFAKIIAGVDGLTNEIQDNFNKTKSVKQEAFLNILKKLLLPSLTKLHSALLTRSALNIITEFKKNKKCFKEIPAKLEATKKYLTENETKVLNNILNVVSGLLSGLPSDVACGVRIAKIVNL